MQWLQALNDLQLPPLIKGNHPDGPEHGMCAMEMISYMERQPFSDKPEGVCEILRGLTITINDTLDHNDRQKLMPVLPELVDTVVDPETTQKRARFVMDTAHRTADWRLRGEFDRSPYRGAGYGHHMMEKVHQQLSQGLAGAFTVIKECTPPWQLADVMIGILRDAIKIGTEKPRREFKQPEQVKELATVTYLPEEKRKKSQSIKFEPLLSHKIIKHHQVFAVDVA